MCHFLHYLRQSYLVLLCQLQHDKQRMLQRWYSRGSFKVGLLFFFPCVGSVVGCNDVNLICSESFSESVPVLPCLYARIALYKVAIVSKILIAKPQMYGRDFASDVFVFHIALFKKRKLFLGRNVCNMKVCRVLLCHLYCKRGAFEAGLI